ncbi:MAG: ribonuclease PH [Planctomycetes bacterium]|nr:ribonuclease PH [Planctomycetota bacterium]
MRPVSFQRAYVCHPAGSCLVSFGMTKVLCTATLELSLPPWRRDSGLGWLSAEYAMLPGSTGGGRKRREHSKRDGRSIEIQRLIGRCLRAAVDFEALGAVSLTIDCDVIQADGGTRTAAISGGYVALVDALTVLAERQGKAGPEVYLKGQLAAVSVGIVKGEVVCDLDYAHDSTADVDMNVVALGDQLVEVQGTGEGGTFDRAQLEQLLDSAQEGIQQIQAAQRAALEAPLPEGA